MLITFRCKAYANVTMFGSVGLQMIKMMGHSGTVPGAIGADDIPHALDLLKLAITAEKKREDQNDSEQDDDDKRDDPPVSISHRALPLVDMLNAAISAECGIMWDSE
ncbi:DUF1840 domain-containing protein [Vibrio sp. ABG19]|uniref:DUF1840 domain-containing protein n=1 Tax=Vibrio sp. ABG19 TaxID=2817385 RepID=UPI00249EF665|nr:DUF1840 domain-containing protein [Vibrio sp. ABG19]WGY46875.1 DUF1840 domain-containing protein [Vibrio sp. ABG19]